MLDLVLNRVGTNNDGTLMYLEDATEWPSIIERKKYTLFVQAFHERVSGPVEITNIIENATYFTTESIVNNDVSVIMNGIDVVYTANQVVKAGWTMELSNDGYYSITSVAVSSFPPTENGNYGTDLEGNLVKQEDGEYVIKEVSDLVEDENFTDWTNLKTLLLARTSIYSNEKWLQYFQESQKYFNDGGHYPELFRLKRASDFAKSALNSAQYVWELDNYTGAQSIIENMEELWQM